MSNTKRATGVKTTSPKTTSPAEPFDLDAFEAEAASGREPFKFKLGGEEFVLPHLQTLDWKDSLSLGSDGLMGAQELLRRSLGDDYERFEAKNLSVQGYNRVMQAWGEHSGATTERSAGW